jgi:hypothetical protein
LHFDDDSDGRLNNNFVNATRTFNINADNDNSDNDAAGLVSTARSLDTNNLNAARTTSSACTSNADTATSDSDSKNNADINNDSSSHDNIIDTNTDSLNNSSTDITLPIALPPLPSRSSTSPILSTSTSTHASRLSPSVLKSLRPSHGGQTN